MELSDPRALRALLDRHGVRAAKRYGQHFLVDRSVLRAIIDAAEIGSDDDVLEVGPGPGVLTRALSERARSVAAVEADPRMLDLAREALADRGNVLLAHANALEVDLYAVGPSPPTRIVANLPYRITSPLLERFLAHPRRPPLVVVLVQEEVARRIVADPSDARERGYLSVFVQAFAEPRIVRRVPARAFRPPPKVGSAVVAMRTRAVPAFAPLDQRRFLRLVSDAFRHRRKQLGSALTFEAGASREAAARALSAAGIEPRRRPEELSMAEWVALAGAMGVPPA
ncbi:MAG: 16S rRNA (adenine(1518)-N(6)/adenine(1519)-N(6))-dimethyltransferase RsmA [Candidatus Limnocylindria bacterium]